MVLANTQVQWWNGYRDGKNAISEHLYVSTDIVINPRDRISVEVSIETWKKIRHSQSVTIYISHGSVGLFAVHHSQRSTGIASATTKVPCVSFSLDTDTRCLLCAQLDTKDSSYSIFSIRLPKGGLFLLAGAWFMFRSSGYTSMLRIGGSRERCTETSCSIVFKKL